MSGVTGAAVGAVALGAASSAYSANRANAASRRANRTAQQQADLSSALFEQSDPLRQSLMERSEQFLGSGMESVMDSPTYLAFKEATGENFGRARENTLSRLPAGGALLESLADIEGSQASTLSQGAGQIYENELSRALSLATGNVPVALGGLGQAAASQSANAAAMGQQSSAKADATGQAAGAYLGSK